jgi:hypothetical protein
MTWDHPPTSEASLGFVSIEERDAARACGHGVSQGGSNEQDDQW